MRAVVVEDEILIREGLCKLLSRMFPEIVVEGVAGNGQEGLDCIERYRPDLVITDIKMPGMDGLEMLQRVQELGIDPKVIVLTAYSEFAYAQQAVKLGVYDYVVKPVVVQEFVSTIRKLQNIWEQEQKRTPDTMGTLETVVSGILYGVSSLDGQVEEFLDKKYGITADTLLIELLVYMGDCFENDRTRKRKELCRLLDQKACQYCMSADELPDIAILDSPDHASYVEMGIFEDLTGKFDVGNYYEGTVNSCTVDGKLYGVPFGVNCLALYYNEDMLTEAGCEVPTTWDELMTTAKALTTDSVSDLALCSVQNEEGTFNFVPWLWSTGATSYDRLGCQKVTDL